MASICIISSDTVKATKTSQTNKALIPWDLQLLVVGPIQNGLLFPLPNSSQQKNISPFIQHLKTSLSHTLNFFPPLAGRLAAVQHHDMINYYINCNNAGVLFVHASADALTISDLIQSTYVPTIVKSFFPLNGIKNLDGIVNPLLGVQITELQDGIFIGCTINHLVGDGSSLWYFFNSWSEISRSIGDNNTIKISKIPKFSLPDGVDCTVRNIPRSTVEEKYSLEYVLPPLKERVYHFTRREIVELKSRANSEMGTNKISSLQALLSHVWRSVIRCRKMDPEEETKYKLMIDARTRLNLSSEYFGNAIQAGTVSLKAKELLENGIGFAAWKMNQMVALHSGEMITRFNDEWMDLKLFTMENMTKNALVTSCSPRFNVYGNDFGWGKPIAMRTGEGNKHDGKITVFEGVEDGSIDIEVCLPPEVLEAMENDIHFMAAVSF
ncbi:HXXXD-type acyl-transferase family protein [Euphorbia peplus]|nr:HXXXD-type acyl-transferase family protein [Euphorbia peplus]